MYVRVGMYVLTMSRYDHEEFEFDFGGFLQASVLFQWDNSAGRFIAPLQREREEKKLATAIQGQEQETVCSFFKLPSAV